jgi:NAD(P)-dependent dehydrogenase (short-subunit alcohol dehydrogenase family)
MSILEKFSLDGKVALVTGGSGLYGRQIVLALAEAGAKVYTASRNFESNESYAASLREKGMKAAAAVLDQSDEQSVLALRDGILKNDGKIHILVNNAVARTMKRRWRDREPGAATSCSAGTGAGAPAKSRGSRRCPSSSAALATTSPCSRWWSATNNTQSVDI